jgi:hypothetical protein
MQKSIGGIEAQKLISALNPPLRKTDVIGCGSCQFGFCPFIPVIIS